MSKFHSLRVQDVRQETPDAVSIAFEVPDALKATFEFKHGQYVTLKLTVNGEELRRSYSICSSPLDGELRIAVKRVPDGRASGFLNSSVRAGDAIEMMPPEGNFTSALDAGNQKHYVLFAAGSGITPVISIAKTVLAKEPGSKVSLFYGNRDENSVIFKGALDQLAAANTDRFGVHYFYSRSTPADNFYGGRITSDKARDIVQRFVANASTCEYFICGPEQMIFSVKDELAGLNVPTERVHFELFTTPVGDGGASTAPAPAGDFSGTAQVTIILDGDEVDFELASDGAPILDAALDAGADVPFACKGAVCCTCRAKVLEGSVAMEKNFALTDDEIEDGFVLTCQSHPTSAKVVIDYDEI